MLTRLTECLCASSVFPFGAELVKEFGEGAFFDAGDVGARNAEFFRDLSLGFFLAVRESEASANHFLLALVEQVQAGVDLHFFQLQLDFVQHFVRLGAEDVDQGDLIAFIILYVSWRLDVSRAFATFLFTLCVSSESSSTY